MYTGTWGKPPTGQIISPSNTLPSTTLRCVRNIFYSPENPVQTYFDTLIDQQANWIDAIAATTINVQRKEECSKGMLISHSEIQERQNVT